MKTQAVASVASDPAGGPSPAPLWIRLVAGLTRRLPRGKHYVVEWLCRGSQRRFIGRLPIELGGYSFDCSLRDQLARLVYFAGSFEAPEIAFVRATLKLGMTFVDVGANWGLFSLFAASRVGVEGKVVAFEPDLRIYCLLQANAARNALAQMQTFALAVGDRERELTLAAHDHAAENWGISRVVSKASESQPTLVVPCKPLDAVLEQAGVQTVDLVKIDVEGAEDLVLSGMADGLRKQRYRRIMLELHPHELGERQRTMQEVTEVLAAAGYRGCAFDHSPDAVRRAYYHPNLAFSGYLKPLVEGLRDSHPHTLWLAPGEPALVAGSIEPVRP
jgi:FkbM family methyltransferase